MRHIADVSHGQIDLDLNRHLQWHPREWLHHHERGVLAAIRLRAQHIFAKFLVAVQEMRIAERYRKPIVTVGHVQQSGGQTCVGCAAEALVALIVHTVVHGVRFELVSVRFELADFDRIVADAILCGNSKSIFPFKSCIFYNLSAVPYQSLWPAHILAVEKQRLVGLDETLEFGAIGRHVNIATVRLTPVRQMR